MNEDLKNIIRFKLASLKKHVDECVDQDKKNRIINLNVLRIKDITDELSDILKN
jgi:hypothetical protein